MPRPLARAIVILLAPAFAVVGLAPSRADDPKPQAEKKAVQSAGAKETGKTPAAGGGAKPKDAPAAAKPSSDKDAPAAAKPAATAPHPLPRLRLRPSVSSATWPRSWSRIASPATTRASPRASM